MSKTVTVDWLPNKKSKEPVYQQIVDYISRKISSGDWAVGYRLPSQRILAEKFQVNRSTVSIALDILEAYGIIEGRVGKGTVIISNTWSLMFSSKEASWGSYVKSGYFKENLPTIQVINKLEFVDGITRLGTGEMSPDLFPKEAVTKAIQSLAPKMSSLNYLGPLGLDELRETLSYRLKEFGIEAKPSNILITSGSLQALQLISISMLKPNSKIYCEIPSYINSLQVFQSAGMKLEGVTMDTEGLQYWNMGENMKTKTPSLLYTIPTHHNPTGVVMSEQRRREVYKFCNQNAIPIIEDDAYCELYHLEKPPRPIKAMDESGSVLYLGTVSKSFAPGLRIGWVVGPESIIERLGDVKMQLDYGASSLSQILLNEVFINGSYDAFLAEFRVILERRKNKMLEALEEYLSDIAKWNQPTGGYYIWLDFMEAVPVEKLFNRALEKEILLNTGNIYHMSKTHSLRLSFAYINEDVIVSAIKELSEMARTLI
ncbi:PLP-dependent aminotransferase family protein [Sinanaerobacter sp. ZZT-01]|uniref:aminotransferase-like domain-containing protein n=1 Tax=Sinanaerobacter sp. ZZT-01 TaxID=3111540 RepID=UPI002D7771D9|nr:PLP-dependent aminotransferase family protein [Sinanaerobacter sp. ZZT-01]WRR92157.1 PLP-dependent aminotransferase family protein [Sinanaerobacter sp. ZZT-01]